MDERRAVEVLRTVRSVFDNIPAPCEEREALDHAIATIERVAGAPVVELPSRAGPRMAGSYLTITTKAAEKWELSGQRVRLVPDPQPDGQEGA